MTASPRMKLNVGSSIAISLCHSALKLAIERKQSGATLTEQAELHLPLLEVCD